MQLVELIMDKLKNETVEYRAYAENFELIYDSVSSGNYDKAGFMSYKALEAGCIDVRYICYYLFSQWYQSKDVAFYIVCLQQLQEIHQLLQVKIESGNIKASHYNAAMLWLHKSFLAHANYETSVQFVDADQKNHMLKVLQNYFDFYETLFPQADISTIHQLLNKWSELKIATKEVLPEGNQEAINVEMGLVDIQQDQKTVELNQIATDINTAMTETNKSSMNATMGNLRWHTLLENLKRYKQQIDSKQWLSAAVMHKKIQHVLENFNPIDYFPEIFYEFLSSSLKGYGQITSYQKHAQHPAWQLMEKMYEVNPQLLTEIDEQQYIELLQKDEWHDVMPKGAESQQGEPELYNNDFDNLHQEKHSDNNW